MATKKEVTAKSEGIVLNKDEKPKARSGFNSPQFTKQRLVPVQKWISGNDGSEFFKSEAINCNDGRRFEPLFFTGSLIDAFTVSKSKLPLFTDAGYLNPVHLWSNTRSGLVIAVE